MKRVLGIAAALLFAIGGALWSLREDSQNIATPEVAEHRQQPPNPARAEAERRAPPSARPPPEIATTLPVPTEQPTETLVQALAQRAQDGFGPRLVDYLARQGLSRADAEPIVVQLLGKTVTCALDALREQAFLQRVDFDQVLNALEAELYDADGPLLSALVDVGAVDRRAIPCSMTAMSQAGIPPEAASDLFPRQNR
jgi:hypothetical protein